MDSRKPTILAGLAKVRGQIERWRRGRKKRGPMPEELWDAAVALARRHGVNPICEALHLNYYALKKRVDGKAKAKRTPRPTFVEVPVWETSAPSPCVVELRRADGARMTIRMGGNGDLVALSQAFLGGDACSS